MEITNEHFNLLIELRKNPLASLESLGKRLGIAPNTVRARIARLKADGVLRGDETYTDPVLGERKRTEVVGIYDPAKIGLFRVHVIFQDIPSHKAWQTINNLLDSHPYTYYKVSGFDRGMNIYSQFDLPLSTLEIFEDWIRKKNEGVNCDRVLIFSPRFFLNTEDQLTNWDAETHSWKYEIPAFTDCDGHHHQTSPYSVEQVQMKMLDLNLLRELTINGKVHQRDILPSYDVDQSTLSRRIARLRKAGVIQRFNLIYNRSVFNLDSVFLIWGRHDRMGCFIERISDFPFLSNLSFDPTGNFLWHIHCPTTVAGDLFRELFNIGEVHMMTIQQSTGLRYYFYPRNHTGKNWITDREYICPD